jgi:hypothetical protein
LTRHDVLTQPPHLRTAHSRARISAEYRAAHRDRQPSLQAYRETLTARGYRIVAVPDLRSRHLAENASGLRDFVFCNVLPGLNQHRPSVHYLPTGVDALDAAARRAYEEAGVQPVAIGGPSRLAAATIERAAGLRCFCGAMP